MKLLFLLFASLICFNIQPVYSQNDTDDPEMPGKNQEIRQFLDSNHYHLFLSALFGMGLIDNEEDGGLIDLPPMSAIFELSVVFSHIDLLDIICGFQYGSFGNPDWLALQAGAGTKELIFLPVSKNFYVTAQLMLAGSLGICFERPFIDFSSGSSLMPGLKGELLINLVFLNQVNLGISTALGLYNHAECPLYWMLGAKAGVRF